MKRIIVLFVVAVMVLATTVIWIVSSGPELKTGELIQFGIIVLVVGFALFLGYKRVKSHKAGEPQEDELSKKILQKTASWSYYISLYMWLIVMYLSDKVRYETHTLIAGGILAMAVTFAVCWLIIRFMGLRNE